MRTLVTIVALATTLAFFQDTASAGCRWSDCGGFRTYGWPSGYYSNPCCAPCACTDGCVGCAGALSGYQNACNDVRLQAVDSQQSTQKVDQQGPVTVTAGYPPIDSFPVASERIQINPLTGRPMKSPILRTSSKPPTVNAFEKTPAGQDASPRTYRSSSE